MFCVFYHFTISLVWLFIDQQKKTYHKLLFFQLVTFLTSTSLKLYFSNFFALLFMILKKKCWKVDLQIWLFLLYVFFIYQAIIVVWKEHKSMRHTGNHNGEFVVSVALYPIFPFEKQSHMKSKKHFAFFSVHYKPCLTIHISTEW